MSWPLGYFGYDPSRKEPGKRLHYITQNGIMSMASHGLSHTAYSVPLLPKGARLLGVLHHMSHHQR